MDEVFDLKEKNQWLRRNIKNLLQQLIRATYGDTINRDSYWPNGILAETPPRRDKCIRMRTRVAAKTSLLGIMPDELKHIIGADTTRKGILRVFDMFQYQPMNRRLVYVFLEGFLETMFPQYKFPELFVKLHSRSPRIHRYSQKLQCSSLKSFRYVCWCSGEVSSFCPHLGFVPLALHSCRLPLRFSYRIGDDD
ncbi:sorting nexin 13 [Goodea atripinnis]|uniref:Sorting nexin 13 n=1 Tax=Goodea atripinnis TaxID=208336 RepID=A0ABV0P2B7_9TELE